jgi:hypothetical protein
MEINLSKTVKQVITTFLLLIMPLLAIVLGLFFNVLTAWYYIICVTWFGAGIIFFSAIN